MKKANECLSHTVWKCKYPIVFGPKYRRQIIYGKYKTSIGKIVRELSKRKGVEILETTACREHVRRLVSSGIKVGGGLRKVIRNRVLKETK